MEYKNHYVTSTPTGLQLLTIAFVVLKLCGVVGWSWWWVLSPMLIPLGFVGVVLAFCGVLWAIGTIFK